ncbi:MAG TPA: phosphoribosylaminoimidazolesuccinocarboxamide synthase, partial [Deltaproteobacteria bacterium]|nr:phosphoribosylaminoimidazolesuccinocarboxamide synthase [Deltaproteobacteria bacterium]
YLLIVATDRISAFDVVLPTAIPDKGKVLTQISLFWFQQMAGVVENHVVEADASKYPEPLKKYQDVLEGRSMIVRKASVYPVECVVRGYVSGSAWSEYRKSGSICGIKLPEGLVESAKLDVPIFTPTTKAEEGHDLAITIEEMQEIVGPELTQELSTLTVNIYRKAAESAEKRGIIIADTKFEFGRYNGKTILIDECLTPDSSRFWSIKGYRPGQGQDSYDKQIVRDYLNTLDWDKTYPGPELPPEIIEKARARYVEILEIITGKGLK